MNEDNVERKHVNTYTQLFQPHASSAYPGGGEHYCTESAAENKESTTTRKD